VPGDRRSAPRADEVLDYVGALRRWNGDEAAYRAALSRFGDDFAATAGRWRELARQDAAALAVEAHRTRGVAGNIGLNALAAALGLLERDCSAAAGKADAALDAALAGLDAALAAIAALPPWQAPAQQRAAAAAADTVPVAEAAAVLARALARGAIDDRALASLAAGWHGPAGALDALHEAIRNFDFDRARSMLDMMIPRETP
jgi:HPt (histidine-containing phosphotransfer) domain-containing protein